MCGCGHICPWHWDRAGCPVPASGAFLTCSSLHNQVVLALSLSLAFPMCSMYPVVFLILTFKGCRNAVATMPKSGLRSATATLWEFYYIVSTNFPLCYICQTFYYICPPSFHIMSLPSPVTSPSEYLNYLTSLGLDCAIMAFNHFQVHPVKTPRGHLDLSLTQQWCERMDGFLVSDCDL